MSATKDTPAPKPEAKPRARVTIKMATEWIAARFSEDDAEGEPRVEAACCDMAGMLFEQPATAVKAHVDALRAKAKADATLAALMGKGGK